MNRLTLHPWIGSNPVQSVENLEASAFKWNILSTITAVAISAITLSVMIAPFFFTVPLSITLLSIAITPILSFLASYFQNQYKEYQDIIDSEKPVAVEFQNIKNWNEEKIAEFLQGHKILLPPRENLLPLIARFNGRIKQAQEARAEAQKLSAYVPDRNTRTWQRNLGWSKIEEVAIPALLEAAFVLRILKYPNQTTFFPDHFELTQKTFTQRAFDLRYDQNDDYLTSKTGLKISFTTLCGISDVEQLYNALWNCQTIN